MKVLSLEHFIVYGSIELATQEIKTAATALYLQ